MKQKVISTMLLLSMGATLLAGCGTTAGNGTEGGASNAAEGKVINIYSWNDEFRTRVEAVYPEVKETSKDGTITYLKDGTEIHWVVNPNQDGVYQQKLDEALSKQADAAADDKIDLFLSETDYVFKYHAIVSIPTLLIMAAIHFFWQKKCDKKAGVIEAKAVESKDVEEIKGGALYKTVYAILPLLPIILLIGSFAVQKITGAQIDISVEVATLFSFIVAIICEIIRKRNAGETLKETEAFFKGMGGSMPIVALLVAGTVFVTGLKSIGLITALQSAMTGLSGGGLGFVLPLILVALTALIVLLSGSGTALFFAMVPLMVPLAAAAGISALAVSIPMGLAGNLLRAVSPVSAVVMIVAGSVKREPLEVVKRTSVPMIAGTVVMFVLSMVIFL